MAKDPAFLFYPNDWIGGTMGMTFEEKGAYMELLMLQFNRGHMTEHMIGQTIGQLFGQVKDKFIKDSEGLWYNERLDIEKEKRKNYTQSRFNNKNGTNQYNKKVGHMTEHMEDVNENINKDIKIGINIDFDIFWDLYDKKRGDKEKLIKKWNGLKPTEREEIIKHIPLYKLSQPDKNFRKDPQTYLNNKSWNDEIIGLGLTIKEEPTFKGQEIDHAEFFNLNN